MMSRTIRHHRLASCDRIDHFAIYGFFRLMQTPGEQLRHFLRATSPALGASVEVRHMSYSTRGLQEPCLMYPKPTFRVLAQSRWPSRAAPIWFGSVQRRLPSESLHVTCDFRCHRDRIPRSRDDNCPETPADIPLHQLCTRYPGQDVCVLRISPDPSSETGVVRAGL